MKFNSIFLSIAIMSSIPFYAVHSVEENVCDQMVRSGTFGDEEISACVKQFGESESFKENLESMKTKKTAEKMRVAVAEGKEGRTDNIEFKKFSTEDLAKAAFKKSFYSTRIEEKMFSSKWKEKTLTEGDTLCKHLGFDKAASVVLSGPIPPTEAKGNGFILPSGNSEMELYTEDKYFMRRFKEVTCARGTSKEIKLTKKILGEIKTATTTLNDVENLNAPRIEKSNEVSDKRKKDSTPSTGSAPFSFKPETETGSR